ncbi:hypothetical protein M1446_01780 [Candidatus Dependentiae bacterium]|nr:hypothetical protein [Candidatus Dependentiae bacterium]
MKSNISLALIMLTIVTLCAGCGAKKRSEPVYDVKIEGAIDARQSGVLNDPDIQWNEEDFEDYK